jgi:hypothetical protein
MTKHNRRGLVLLALAGTATLACQELNAPLYFAGETIHAMGNDDPFAFSAVPLVFRAPTDQERMQLQREGDARGYGMDIPWVSRDKVHLEISYRVTNRSDQMGSFTVIVDGASEYTKYDTSAVATALGGDDPIILPLITTIQRELAPKASFSGIVREDDFAEGELDLDALGRWNDADPNSPTFAGVLLNRSDVNAIGLGLIPGGVTVDPTTGRRTLTNPNLLVVPALVEIDVRLRTDVQMDCEYYVRVRDDDDRLRHNDADDRYQISPTMFQPAALM